jgi:hypothetical protein
MHASLTAALPLTSPLAGICARQLGHVVIPGGLGHWNRHRNVAPSYDNLMYSGDGDGDGDGDGLDSSDFDVDAIGRGAYSEPVFGPSTGEREQAGPRLSLYCQEQSVGGAANRAISVDSVDPDAPRALNTYSTPPGSRNATPKKPRRSAQRIADDGLAYRNGWLFNLRCCITAYYFVSVFFITWMLAVKVCAAAARDFARAVVTVAAAVATFCRLGLCVLSSALV